MRRLRAYIEFGTLVWSDDEALSMVMKIDDLIALPQAQSYSYASNYQLIV
jgi:hypothetical protein